MINIMKYLSFIEHQKQLILFGILSSKKILFDAFIPVFTYEGPNIINRFCEKPGWPNATHEGYMMYDNNRS